MAHILIGGRGPSAHRRIAARCRISAVLVALLCAAPSLAHAQRFALPVDVEQGLVFAAAQPRTPYLFGVRVAPSLDFQRVRVGLALGPKYRNPEWDFALGANVALLVPTSGRKTGIRLAVQGEYLPVERAARVSFGVLVELVGLLRIGLWPAYDLGARRPELCLSLGSDVMSWLNVLSDD